MFKGHWSLNWCNPFKDKTLISIRNSNALKLTRAIFEREIHVDECFGDDRQDVRIGSVHVASVVFLATVAATLFYSMTLDTAKHMIC